MNRLTFRSRFALHASRLTRLGTTRQWLQDLIAAFILILGFWLIWILLP